MELVELLTTRRQQSKARNVSKDGLAVSLQLIHKLLVILTLSFCTPPALWVLMTYMDGMSFKKLSTNIF